MQELEFGKRASEVNFRKHSNVWDLNLKYELETECIKHEMEEKAGTMCHDKGLEAALNDWSNFFKAINDLAAIVKCDARIWDKALRGDLEKESPMMKSIITWRIAFIIAFLTEFTVMVVQQIFTGDFNPVIIILAIMLGVGGFLQGWGIGNLLFQHWQEDTARPAVERTTQNWLLIGSGTLMILVVSVVRGSGAFDTAQFFIVFFITLLFGEAVAMCEALAVKLSAQRRRCLQDMGQAQVKQACQMHAKNLEEDAFKNYYETLVRNANQGKFQMDPNPAQPNRSGTKGSEPSNG